jgi:hypothetical protein
MSENTAETVQQAAPRVEAAAPYEKVGLPPNIAGLIRPLAVLAAVLATVVTGVFYDVGTALLVLAGSVLLLFVSLLWTSVCTLAGDTPLTIDQAIELAAPSAAEEQKRAVLQALKDLEYERSVGKVSEADYRELLARYRTEAKRLLRAADEEMAPLRAKAEAFLEEQGEGAAPRNRRVATRANGDPNPTTARVEGAPSSLACASCRTPNDPDAVFCKKCGARLEGGRVETSSTASPDNANERA